mgnify:FL=1
MSEEIKQIELQIKLAQLQKLQHVLVKKDEVQKKFALFYHLLWTQIDELLISIATNMAQNYNLPFDEIATLMKMKFQDMKNSIETKVD